jgi:hypothetical protein
MRYSILVLLFVFGCSKAGVSSPAPIEPTASPFTLPALPLDSEVSMLKSASFQTGYSVAGSDFLFASTPAFLGPGFSNDVSGQKNGIALQGDRQSSNWAIYRVPYVGENFVPELYSLGLFGGGGTLWVMISDYSKGHWKLIEPSPYVCDAVVDFTPPISPGDWSAMKSPAGNLYILLYATDGLVNVGEIGFSMENAVPLPPVSGLTSTWTEFGLVLSWDKYLDPRASQFLIYKYYRFPPPDPGDPPPPPGSPPQIFARVPASEDGWLYTDAGSEENWEYWVYAYSDEYQLWSEISVAKPGPRP